MRVRWGGNELINCVALLAVREKAMLKVSLSPVRVDFNLPAMPSTPTPIEINSNRIAGSSAEFTVWESPDAVAILWKTVPILMAQQIASDTLLLRTDLRPLGIEIFDDAAGLHVGGSVLTGNNFDGCSIGIGLG